MSFSRQLTFRTDPKTIQNSLALTLQFAKVPSNPPVTQVPWQVIDYGGGGQTVTFTYVQDLIFASPQHQQGSVVIAEAYIELQIGQQTTLVQGTDELGVVFKPPNSGTAGELTATNSSGIPQDLAVGFMDNRGFPNTVLVWPNVGNTLSVEAQYTPILTAFVSAESTSPILLSQDLSQLPPQQVYTLTKNADGSYALVPEPVTTLAVSPQRTLHFDPALHYLHGDEGAIQVTNNLRYDIYVKVTNTSCHADSEPFYKIVPGKTDSWSRSGHELVAVNIGGFGRVTNLFGILGRNLQINSQ